MARDDCDGEDRAHAWQALGNDDHGWTYYECQRCGEINTVWPS